VLVAVVVLAGLSGCGGSPDPVTSVSTAANASLDHTFLITLTLTGAEQLRSNSQQTLRGAGAFDKRHGRGFTQIALPKTLDQQPASQVYLFYFPRTIFLHPSPETAIPRGKRLISVTLTSPQKPATNRFIAQAMSVNPVLLLDEIATGATAATKTGTEVVLHVPLTNYRVTVNLRRALARVSGPYARAERIAIRQQLKALRQGRSSVDFNVRTDGAGFVRRLETTVPGSNLGRITLTLSGYGSTVTIKQPHDQEVIVITSLLRASPPPQHWPWILAKRSARRNARETPRREPPMRAAEDADLA
jgi:hypothetical protein